MQPINKTAIVHFGVGNFHRAHMQHYTNALLQLDPNTQWKICGAMLMPNDQALYQRLREQNGRYSLSTCAPDGTTTVQWIDSLSEVLWAGTDSQAIINKISHPDTKIISLTITEGGYNVERSTGEFNLQNPAVQHDLLNPTNPTTVFGYIAQGLRQRMENGAGPVTILSCDNLQHNGDCCAMVFGAFAMAQDPKLSDWMAQNVTFPNSMVDRITPATTPADVERINEYLAAPDLAPVYCEDFIQWVVEDKFIAGRPDWERVGVEFTADVAPYENMKLSLLNASHTLLSYPAFLFGHRRVDAAMQDGLIVRLVEDFMNLDVTPHVPTPPNTDLALYKSTLVSRFGNSAVSDQIARLCGDGASKFPVYVMPIAKKMIAAKQDMQRVAYLVAAYGQYLRAQKDDNAEGFELFEPWLTTQDWELIRGGNPLDFLRISAFEGTDLSSHTPFVERYVEFCAQIDKNGAKATLAHIL